MSGPSLPAARMGDPIAHGGAVVESSSEALVCVALGAILAPAGCGGAAAAALGAAVGSATRSAATKGVAISVGSLIPGAITGAVALGSPNTFIGGLGAALAVAQPVSCALHPPAPIMTGSASVFVNDHPMARESDRTACGALIAGGAKAVLVGGAASGGPPPNPLAGLSGSAARIATAVGSALAQGASAALRTAGMVDALAQRAAGQVEGTVVKVETGATNLEAQIAAQAGAIVGTTSSGALGPLLGGMLAT
jgi:uncharacterized Zn-binding protein involved in type VI secretion